MSWHGGDEIFERVVKEMIDSGASELLIARVTRTLLTVLIEQDWAQAEESVGLFDHPGVLEGANDVGVYAYGQIPEDGTLSTARIRCNACKRRVHYRMDEDGGVHSELHSRTTGEGTMDGNALCAFSGKGPDGY
jgi:hypothetical protein